MLRAIHFSPLPCSDLGQGVAISTTAFMLPRFFVQTHIFSVSPSSSTAKSKCCCSILQRKGHGSKSISVVAKGSRYNINFTVLQLYRDKSELIPITGFVPFHICRVLLKRKCIERKCIESASASMHKHSSSPIPTRASEC